MFTCMYIYIYIYIYIYLLNTYGLVLRPQTRSSITNGRSEAQLKPDKGPKYQTCEPADRFVVLACVVSIYTNNKQKINKINRQYIYIYIYTYIFIYIYIKEHTHGLFTINIFISLRHSITQIHKNAYIIYTHAHIHTTTFTLAYSQINKQ